MERERTRVPLAAPLPWHCCCRSVALCPRLSTGLPISAAGLAVLVIAILPFFSKLVNIERYLSVDSALTRSALDVAFAAQQGYRVIEGVVVVAGQSAGGLFDEVGPEACVVFQMLCRCMILNELQGEGAL
jgi:hypothetical protein